MFIIDLILVGWGSRKREVRDRSRKIYETEMQHLRDAAVRREIYEKRIREQKARESGR
jgi:hypothetical protein